MTTERQSTIFKKRPKGQSGNYRLVTLT